MEYSISALYKYIFSAFGLISLLQVLFNLVFCFLFLYIYHKFESYIISCYNCMINNAFKIVVFEIVFLKLVSNLKNLFYLVICNFYYDRFSMFTFLT